jgi:hypothetical protein
MKKHYRLVIIHPNDGSTIFIDRYKTKKEIQKRILVSLDLIDSMILKKIQHDMYRIDVVDSGYGNSFNKEEIKELKNLSESDLLKQVNKYLKQQKNLNPLIPEWQQVKKHDNIFVREEIENRK